MTQNRVQTGVPGFDEMLNGGFLPNSVVLLRGAPGTGKTTLSLQFLIEGAVNADEPGLLITFEEFPSSLYRDAESLGWDLKELEDKGKFHLMFTSPEVFLAGLETPDSPLDTLVREKNIRRLVLDSVSHFNRLTTDPQELRDIYTRVANGLRRENIASILLGEESRTEIKKTERGGLSFIVDCIVLLRYVEIESAIQRAIVVLKMRGSDHNKAIQRYEIKSGGLQVIDVFEKREGILSGMPHQAL